MVGEDKLGGPAASRPRRPFNRRQIAAQVIVAAVILASGIGIGVGGTILALKDRIARFPFTPDPRMEGPDPNRPVERWQAELGLTDEQALKVKDVLLAGFKSARDRWMQIAQAEQAEREAFVKSMKGILTAEQFTQWQDEYTQRARHFARWQQRGGPGGPDRRGGSGGPDWRGGPSGRSGQRVRRGGNFDPNRPPEFRWDRSRGFDPNRPPEFGPDRPVQFRGERPPEPSQAEQRP